MDLDTDFQGYGLVRISRILNSIRILKDTVIHFNTDFKDINLHTDFKDYGFSMNKETSGIKLKDDHLIRIEKVKNCPTF